MEITAQGVIPPGQASYLLNALLKDAWVREILDSEKLKDIKGRDKENLLLHPEAAWGPLEQELITVQGYLTNPEKKVGISLYTPFLGFEGNSIFHSLREHRLIGTMPYLPIRLMGYIAPFTITAFRIGIERYESVFKAFSFGSFPEVTASLTLDYAAPNLSVLLSGQRLPSKNETPLHERGFGDRLISLLKSLS